MNVDILKLLIFGMLLIQPATAQVTPIYNNSDGDVDNESWMDNRTTVTLDNTSAYLTRIGTFVIGESPDDTNAGPFLTGLLIGLIIIGTVGASRSGIVTGGVIAIATAAVLSQSAGVAPRWMYGIAIIILGLVLGVVYLRTLR